MQKYKRAHVLQYYKKHLKRALTFSWKYKNLFIFQVSIRNFFFKKDYIKILTRSG